MTELKSISDFTEEEILHFIFMAKTGHTVEYFTGTAWIPSIFKTDKLIRIAQKRSSAARYRIKPHD